MNECRVIIVEDDADMQLLIKQQLISFGYLNDDIVIYSMLSAIQSAHTLSPEVILLDLSLPDSPPELTFKKVQEIFPYSAIIVLTGLQDTAIAVKTIEEGAEDFLVKGDFNGALLQKSLRYAIARRKASNDYKRLFNDSPGAMYIYDEKYYKFLDVNKAAVYQYGYSKQEFLQMDATQIRPESEIERFIESNTNIPDAYHDFGTWQHLRKDGTQFFVQVYAQSTMFDGRRAGVVFAVDINKKVKAEAALKEKSKEMITVLNSITDAFFTLNHAWEFTFVNNACVEMFQSSKEQLLWKNIWECFPQGRKLKFFEEYNKAMEHKISVHFEEYDPVLDLWVWVNAYPNTEGLAVYAINITEQKKAQEKVMMSEQNLRAIINNTKDIIWSIDKEYNIITANNAFWERLEMITGKKAAETGKNDFDGQLFLS